MGDLVPFFVVLPLACSALALVEKALPRATVAFPGTLAGMAGLAALLAVTAPALFGAPPSRILAVEIGSWSSPLGIVLALDGMAWLTSLAVWVVSLATLLYVAKDQENSPLFLFFSLVQIAGIECALLTRDLFNLFVALELVGIAGYVLIAYRGGKRSVLAGVRYLVASTVAMALYLVGVALVYRETGSLSIDTIARLLDERQSLDAATRRELAVAAACFIAGVGLRSAIFPVHVWLPDAHAEAPHAVSAMLSGAVLKVSFVSLVRLAPITTRYLPYETYLWTGVASALVGVVLALAQLDMKRLLAYHSISQMGYIVAGLGASGAGFSGELAPTVVRGGEALGLVAPIADPALSAAFGHVVSHALFKSLLFLSIGMVVDATGEHRIDRLGRCAARLPLPFAAFIVGALSIMGLPPMGGFVSKKLVLGALGFEPVALWVGRVVAVGTVASFLKLSQVFWSGAHGQGSAIVPPRVQWPKVASIAFLAVLCVATGIRPVFWVGALDRVIGASRLLSGLYDRAALAETALTVAAGIGLFLVVRSRRVGLLARALRRRVSGIDGALAWMLGGFVLLVGLSFLIS